MADRVPQRPGAALARTHLRRGHPTNHLGVPRRTPERGNAAEGTNARQRPRLVARGGIERPSFDDGVPVVSPDDVGPRLIEFAGVVDSGDREAFHRGYGFPTTGFTADPPCGYGNQ